MDDMRDLMAPYLLDALEDDERRRFEQYIAEHPEIEEELAVMRRGVDMLVDEGAVPPPPALRSSILDAIAGVEQERPAATPRPVRPPAWRRWVAGVALATAAVVAAVVGVAVSGGGVTPSDVFAATDVRTVVAEVADSEARLAFSLDLGRAVVTFEDLDAVGADETYELWVIDDDGAKPAGLFRPDSGSAEVLLTEPVASGVVVGLTIEPAGGSEQPTGAILATWDVSF